MNLFLTISKLIFICSFLNESLAAVRIVGGSEITIDKCPYQLSLLRNNKHYCGAVVINKSWALTTAACVQGASIKDISLRAGSSSLNTGGVVHEVTQIVSHTSYNAATKDYNIALIKVTKAFDAKTAKPVTLVSEGSIIKPGSQVTVTGWGVLTSGSTAFANKLQITILPIIEQNICKQANGNTVSERMLCAGFISGGKDICNGDFGGPMVYQDKLIGISSSSEACGKPGKFGMYTSISNLRGWIKKTAGV